MSDMMIKGKEHVGWMDGVRVIACFLVCVIHSPLPKHESSLWLSAYNYFSSPCMGLFFMLSGALLFPVHGLLSKYVHKKLRRIVIPLIFWSFLFSFMQFLFGDLSFEELKTKLCYIPFEPAVGVYWFLYVIMGLYLFAPLLSPALEKISNVRYMLLLWILTLILPYLNAWLPGSWKPEAWGIRGDAYQLFASFSGYMGYMVLGYYLRNNPIPKRQFLKWWLIPSLILCLGIPAYFANGRYEAIGNGMLYSYLTINVALLSVIYFTLVQHLLNRSTPLVAFFGKVAPQTFGIYLIHLYVMRDGIWPLWARLFPHAPYAVQIPCVAVLTFAISWALVKLISFIPGSRYII